MASEPVRKYKNLTVEQLIEMAKAVHPDKFDYQFVVLNNGNVKLKDKINIKIKINLLKKLIGSSKEKEIFICPFHGEFSQTLSQHLRTGCGRCNILAAAKNKTKSLYKFISEANIKHKNYYNYEKTVYINCEINIIITCPKHGDFLQQPRHHLSGHGCSKCTNKFSRPEMLWLNLLNIPDEWRNKIVKINGRKIQPDAIDEENMIIYEFHGDYWHGNPLKFKSSEINKVCKKTFGELYQKTIEREKFLKDAGYKLITIWEQDFKSQLKDI